MIYQIIDLPANMVGFKASWEVTKEDFEQVVIPCVEKLVEKTGQLNYLLVLNTPLKNFTMGAWFKDAMMGIRNLSKWRRAAIVSDSRGITYFTNIFSFFMPGEFRGFSHSQMKEAVDWVSEAKS